MVLYINIERVKIKNKDDQRGVNRLDLKNLTFLSTIYVFFLYDGNFNFLEGIYQNKKAKATYFLCALNNKN